MKSQLIYREKYAVSEETICELVIWWWGSNIMGKKLNINIGSLDEVGKRFKDAWQLAESGQEIIQAKECLTFKDLEILLKILTPKRFELLKFLRNQGATSIRNLSKLLKRDYSNVYSDVKQLEFYGLIIKTKEDLIFVPWKEITAHFSLVSPKKPRRKKSTKTPAGRTLQKKYKRAS